MPRILAFIGLLVTAFTLTACGGGAGTSAEEEIRAWVAQGEEAAEARDRRALLRMVSERYSDDRGNDREAVSGLLRLYFLRQNQITLITRIESMTVYDETAAELELMVGMAGSNDTSLLGLSADAKRFRFQLEREDDEWYLISARWGELGESL